MQGRACPPACPAPSCGPSHLLGPCIHCPLCNTLVLTGPVDWSAVSRPVALCFPCWWRPAAACSSGLHVCMCVCVCCQPWHAVWLGEVPTAAGCSAVCAILCKCLWPCLMWISCLLMGQCSGGMFSCQQPPAPASTTPIAACQDMFGAFSRKTCLGQAHLRLASDSAEEQLKTQPFTTCKTHMWEQKQRCPACTVCSELAKTQNCI